MSDPAKTCREGLHWLEEECERRYQAPFSSLEENAQVEMLKTISDDRPEKTIENAGTRLFQFVKAEVIRGYYTSRDGLRALDYKGNAFYPESPGCPGHARG